MVTKTESKPKAATLPGVVRLPSQNRRAAFVRKEMRRQGLSVLELADMTGHCWGTIANYCWLGKVHTKDPRTDTTKNIFNALGYDICFVSKKKSKGIIEI
jgi:hypothetical protein